MLNRGELVSRGHRKLPDYCSVYEAEMIAVWLSLLDMKQLVKEGELPPEVSILVDNRATLHSLRMHKLRGEIKVRVVEEILRFQKAFNCRVILKWVKGHSDNYGNDLADEQAKLGCERGEYLHVRPGLQYIKKVVRERVFKEWQSLWNNLDTCRQSKKLIAYNPSDRHARFLFSKGRLGSRKLTALLTGHNNLKYHVYKRKVSINPNVSPCCRYCEEDLETSWHLLYDCPCFDTRRREFIF